MMMVKEVRQIMSGESMNIFVPVFLDNKDFLLVESIMNSYRLPVSTILVDSGLWCLSRVV